MSDFKARLHRVVALGEFDPSGEPDKRPEPDREPEPLELSLVKRLSYLQGQVDAHLEFLEAYSNELERQSQGTDGQAEISERSDS